MPSRGGIRGPGAPGPVAAAGRRGRWRRPRRPSRPRLQLALWLAGAAALPLAALVLASAAAPDLVRIESPAEGEVVGHEALDVLVRFPAAAGAAPETFRALLNDQDVTEDFTTGENGAFARLRVFPDGTNVLRVEVFGRSRFADAVLVEGRREVRFEVRRPLRYDRG